MHGAEVSKPNSAPEGFKKQQEKAAAFQKKRRKNFCLTGPVAVKPTRPKSTKFFAAFCSQKVALLASLLPPAEPEEVSKISQATRRRHHVPP
jgi:hypothetical protein